MARRRQEYRVPLASRDDISVAVVASQEREIQGRVVDVSRGGISVFLDTQVDPNYAVGKTLLLRLNSKDLGSPLLVKAQIRHCVDVKGGRWYGTDFLDWERLESRVPQELAALFNQRRHCRVELDAEIPMTLETEDASVQLEASLRGVCTTGLSFLTTANVSRHLSEGTRVKTFFRLPNSSEELTFHVRIQYSRSSSEDTILYGADFDEAATEHFEEQRGRLAKYVTTRLLEPLGVEVT